MAQPGRGRGLGFGGGRGSGAGTPGADDRFQEDREVFHFLLINHERITRTVKQLDNGVETLTESKDADIAAKIKEHLKWMEHRIHETQPIHMRDPLFAEIFKHTEFIRAEAKRLRKWSLQSSGMETRHWQS